LTEVVRAVDDAGGDLDKSDEDIEDVDVESEAS
jgi:hypothetical protein